MEGLHYKVKRYDRTACGILIFKIKTNNEWSKVNCAKCLNSAAYRLRHIRGQYK
jgi:hypothetical protein